ncbi:MAG: alkaline phosphatase family protein [Betaproteobacteria bacterium]
MSPIDHVFVLVLENRSFDHFFGLSGRASVPRPADPDFQPGATDRAAFDPPHEFDAVQAQVAGGAMSSFDPRAKRAFLASQVPVLSQLADEFVLFDNWFASVPGPTWPNRFFLHAASSGGLATSPTQLQESGATITTKTPFRFEHGTIFDRLASRGKKWRVYHGDVHPQVLALPGMVRQYLNGSDHFCPLYDGDPHFSNFAADVADSGYEPAYTFIEPNYAIRMDSQFRFGDSQHPLGLVSAGEALIKYVYEAIRNSPLWPTSALLVTWDEHGGYYDHVAPPAATPPGDAPLNAPTKGRDPKFAFDRLGVRVPALLISPLAPRGWLGSELFPGACFDHASLVRSVFETFALGAPLTARDASAPSWNACLRADARGAAQAAPTVLAATVSDLRSVAETPAPRSVDAVDGFLAGAALIAHELDHHVAAESGRAPVANAAPQSAAAYAAARRASLRDPQFRSHVVQYINEVGVRVRGQQARRAAVTKP